MIAGVYTLKEWLDKQVKKRGGIIENVAAKVTQTCSHCGHEHEKRIGSEQYHVCESCGREFDVDVRAAINCLKFASGDVTRPKPENNVPRYQRVREIMNDKKKSARDDG